MECTFFEIVFYILGCGVSIEGWCDYFSTLPNVPHSQSNACVAIKVLRLGWVPICPVSSPFVVYQPSPSLFACRGHVQSAAFNSLCNKWFWKCYAWAWLRFITFGLLMCWSPTASEDNAQKILQHISISQSRYQDATAAGGGGGSGGSNQPQPEQQQQQEQDQEQAGRAISYGAIKT